MAAPTTSAQEAGRPQPQTTVEGSGPFIRNSQAGRAPIYNVTGGAFGGTLTQPLVARPGYFRNFRVTHTFVTTGTITGGYTATADSPFSLNGLIQLKDAFGTPLIVGDGYSVTQLIPMLGGAFGLNNGNNFAVNLPSYTVISATTGAGTFSYSLPLEFSKAYGVLSAANASLLPTLQFNYNPWASISSTGTVNLPTISTQVDTDFYWLPEGTAGVEPPGLGTTRQWQVVQANPPVTASASARIQFPRLGGYLDTIAAIVRDNTAARNDGYWPSRLQWYVDGVPLVDTTMTELYDDMAIAYGYGTGLNTSVRPAGVVAFCRKTSLNQQSLGLLDTGEVFLSTNPATLMELNFAPAGAGTNSPATLSCLVGQIVPTGAIIQGLPEL
jgi:hypothetical protein